MAFTEVQQILRDINNTAVAVVVPASSTVEQDLYRFTIPAGMISGNGVIYLQMWGTFTTALSILGTLTVRVYYGTTPLIVTNGISLLASLTAAPFRIETRVMASTTTSELMVGYWLCDSLGNADKIHEKLATIASNTAASNDLAVTVQFSAITTGASFTRLYAKLQLKPGF